MGSIRIVKGVNDVYWLEIDGLMLRVEGERLLVRKDNETFMLPCEVIYEKKE